MKLAFLEVELKKNKSWILKISRFLGDFKFLISVSAIKHLISLPFIPPFHILLLKSKIKELIQRCFSKKNGKERYQYLVIGRD
jgi:hypothetical protein